MNKPPSRPAFPPFVSATAAALLLAAGAATPALAHAGDPVLSCPDFVRSPGGGWRVLAPVMLQFGDRLYSPTVGTVFTAGSIQGGIEMSDVLDRECGNR
jgi:hypothetical protein